ncbi:MAG: MBOAT family protein [Lachnospiraceae bacterium]|nr:MBOAT family protein [Lachnospiraceae bacterium]
MLFNSIDYLIFFPIVFLVYYALPKRVRYIWLLIASYCFYMRWNPWYIMLLIGCTVITYISARLIERDRQQRGKGASHCRRTVLIICVLVLLSVLGYFKYYDFFLGYFNKMLSILHISPIDRRFSVLLPVGISFYILQALGYVFDVYRGETYAEKNFLRYALFVSFFPQLVAGPIERSKNLLTQLAKPVRLSWHDFCKGLLLIVYGLFCKMVIADRIAIVVNTVYDDSASYPGMYIAYAAFLFSFQIYCDFYGYSTIARGSSLLFGIKLTDNFNAPYYSGSVKEFWRRWHISLSSWFRDYLYIPLGGNRKGEVRKECNLLFVFGVSGLWHGASVSFIVWGFLNGLYQVIGDVLHKLTNRMHQISGGLNSGYVSEMEQGHRPDQRGVFSRRLLHVIMTFILITMTWIFFAADQMKAALRLIKQLFSTFNWEIFLDGSVYNLGVTKEYTRVMFLGIAVLMAVDYLKYKGKDVAELVLKQGEWFQILCFVSLTAACMLFGCYGEIYDTQQFIYFQF